MRRTLSICAVPLLLSSAVASCGSSTKPASDPAAPPPSASAAKAPVAVAMAPQSPSITLAESGINPVWMDPKVDPCQDFFGYACGGFVKTESIPADRATWGTTEGLDKTVQDFLHSVLEDAAKADSKDPVVKKIGDYYAACMDDSAITKAGISAISTELAVARSVKSPASLYAAITKLHALGLTPAFSLTSGQDLKDATQEIGGLDQDGLGLPDRDYYLKDEGNMKAVREFYVGHVGRMLELAGLPPKDAKGAALDVMRIETALAKLAQDNVTRRDPHAVYHRVDRDGLEKLAKRFPWAKYFAEMGIPDVKAISVNSTEYFAKLDDLMLKEKPAAWVNYLTWQVISEESPKLSDPFVNEDFALKQKLRGIKEIAPRWKRCLRSIDKDLGELVAQPFVASLFAGDSKERSTEIVLAIHRAMDEELSLLPWMDTATRDAAKGKLAQIHNKVGYPDAWRKYDFEVSRTSYATNVSAAHKFDLHRRLSKIGKPVDRGEWDMTPQTVNAYYDPMLNEIVLPAAQLQPPFFSRAFYPPVNIGEVGANTIGHEITHAFDDEGSQFDAKGNLRDWWTGETKAKFAEAVKCVQNQFSGYEAVPGVHLNGELTSGENIADIGGVKLGYAALMAWKKAHPEAHKAIVGQSDETLFFLGYAQGWCDKSTNESLELQARTDPHSPARFRVNGPVSDVPAFSEAFSCKVGTPMNPGKVCDVW